MNEILVVLTNAVPGMDNEFNEWYSGRHLSDVLALEGFVAAQRFEAAAVEGSDEPAHRYLAIYELQPGQAEVAKASLAAARQAGTMEISASMNRGDTVAWFFHTITDRMGSDHHET